MSLVCTRLQYSRVGGMRWSPAGLLRDQGARAAEPAAVMAGACYLWQSPGPLPVAERRRWATSRPGGDHRIAATRGRRRTTPTPCLDTTVTEHVDMITPSPRLRPCRDKENTQTLSVRCSCFLLPALVTALDHTVISENASQYPNAQLGVVVAIATQTSGRNSVKFVFALSDT